MASRIDPDFKNNLLYPLKGLFDGSIVRIEGTYAYIGKDGTNDWIYMHRNNVNHIIWNKLTNGSRCHYRIAFNLHGPSAAEVGLGGAH
jgi:hypothetical protein